MSLDYAFLELPVTIFDVTGKVEHTELTEIDRAVAGFFQSVLDSLVVSDAERKENREFARFVAKDKGRKIYAGDFSDPVSFLSKLTAKLGDKVQAERSELLPVCYVSRDPAIVFTDGSDYIDLSAYAEIERDGMTVAVVNKSFVNLSYNVNLLAWNKPTLSRMALGLMMWMRHIKKGRQHVFSAKTMLADAEMESRIEVKGLKDAMTSPVEIDHDSQRLFACTVTFEVTAEVFEAEEVSKQTGTLGARLAICE